MIVTNIVNNIKLRRSRSIVNRLIILAWTLSSTPKDIPHTDCECRQDGYNAENYHHGEIARPE